MFGDDDLEHARRGQPAPRLRAASARVATSIDRSPASMARWANGQHEDDVDERQRQRGLPTRQLGSGSVDRHDPDHEHDRRDGQRQQAQELDHPLHAAAPEM